MIDWNLVGEVAGLGFVVLFIVVGVVAIVVWVIGLLHKLMQKKSSQ